MSRGQNSRDGLSPAPCLAGDVFRARLIVGLAVSKSYSQLEAELGTSRPTIARWRRRFEEDGFAGLESQHKGSQPRIATPNLQARVIRKTVVLGNLILTSDRPGFTA